MTETTRKIIKCAYELLKDRKRWTTRVLARTKSGHEVAPADPRAVRWCADGALQHCAAEIGTSARETEVSLARKALIQALDGLTISSVNDRSVANGGGYKAIMAGFEKALHNG